MTLAPDKQAVLDKLNREAQAAHEEAVEKSKRAGRPAPAAPTPFTPEQIEYPRWMYHPSGESKVVQDAKERDALGAGWVESPAKFPKAETKSKTKE